MPRPKAPRVKLIRINHGLLGYPDTRRIENTMRKWMGKLQYSLRSLLRCNRKNRAGQLLQYPLRSLYCCNSADVRQDYRTPELQYPLRSLHCCNCISVSRFAGQITPPHRLTCPAGSAQPQYPRVPRCS